MWSHWILVTPLGPSANYYYPFYRQETEAQRQGCSQVLQWESGWDTLPPRISLDPKPLVCSALQASCPGGGYSFTATCLLLHLCVICACVWLYENNSCSLELLQQSSQIQELERRVKEQFHQELNCSQWQQMLSFFCLFFAFYKYKFRQETHTIYNIR